MELEIVILWAPKASIANCFVSSVFIEYAWTYGIIPQNYIQYDCKVFANADYNATPVW